MRILIIEDDQETVETIGLAFNIRWPEAKLSSTNLGKKGVEMVEAETPDVVILDLGLPDINGFDLLKEIRSFSKVPIIITTVRAEESDIVRGLELGADEYLVKPFGQLELLARVQALIRRQQSLICDEVVVCGPLRFGPSMSKLLYEGKEINLTKTEGLILYYLMKNAGSILNYITLAEWVWGDYYPGADDNLRVYIRHLREKIETNPSHPKIILTKIGVGYYIEKPG
jgi:two-component system KDP operon response regulator KdpE